MTRSFNAPQPVKGEWKALTVAELPIYEYVMSDIYVRWIVNKTYIDTVDEHKQTVNSHLRPHMLLSPFSWYIQSPAQRERTKNLPDKSPYERNEQIIKLRNFMWLSKLISILLRFQSKAQAQAASLSTTHARPICIHSSFSTSHIASPTLLIFRKPPHIRNIKLWWLMDPTRETFPFPFIPFCSLVSQFFFPRM